MVLLNKAGGLEMRLLSAKKRYEGQWLAFKFSDELKSEGRVLCHDKDRSRVLEKLASSRKIPPRVYLTFAGPVLPKKYGIVLLDRL